MNLYNLLASVLVQVYFKTTPSLGHDHLSLPKEVKNYQKKDAVMSQANAVTNLTKVEEWNHGFP